jgi:hypothetical protein
MKLEWQNPDNTSPSPGQELNVLILGEDPEMTTQALDAFGRLEINLKNAGQLSYRKWDFEDLGFTPLREVAATEAAAADLIVIGLRDDKELPWMLYAWMKRWLELRTNLGGALVIVLDADLDKSATAKGMVSQLKQLAALGHMDFFVKSGHGGEEQAGETHGGQCARQFVMTRPSWHGARIAGRCV